MLLPRLIVMSYTARSSPAGNVALSPPHTPLQDGAPIPLLKGVGPGDEAAGNTVRDILVVMIFVSSSGFKQFLELEPQLRDVIGQFHQSQYASCLKTLEGLRDSFMLDMYLANHIAQLYSMIRNKALIQVMHLL